MNSRIKENPPSKSSFQYHYTLLYRVLKEFFVISQIPDTYASYEHNINYSHL